MNTQSPKKNTNWLALIIVAIVTLIFIIAAGSFILDYVHNFHLLVHEKKELIPSSSPLHLFVPLIYLLGAFVVIILAYLILKHVLIDLGKFFEYLVDKFGKSDKDDQDNKKP